MAVPGCNSYKSAAAGRPSPRQPKAAVTLLPHGWGAPDFLGAALFAAGRGRPSLGQEAEVHLDGDRHTYRLAVLRPWFETPLRNGVQCLFIQTEAESPKHAEFVRQTIRADLPIDDHASLEPRGPGFIGVRGLDFVYQRRIRDVPASLENRAGWTGRRRSADCLANRLGALAQELAFGVAAVGR